MVSCRTHARFRRYWRWSDVRGMSAVDGSGQPNTALPAFTAPGRSVQLALRADF